MSGVVGMIQLDGRSVDAHLLQQMTAHLAFRGPEAQRMWLDHNVGLGHAQFTTVDDVDSVTQPYSLDGQVWITADARIDGRSSLIKLLQDQDHDVTPQTADAALILHAYLEWGIDCVQQLIGDFAFAIWDAPERRLFCARDHFGVTPFFYANVANCLIVSNTLNCIRLHPHVSDTLNDETIGDLLVFMLNRRFDTTIWQDVQLLPPAHMLLAEAGGVQIRRYWQPPEEGEYVRYKKPETYVEHFQEIFQQAVGDRLRSQRMVAELTGGMDTSSIVGTAVRLIHNGQKATDLRTQTIAFRSLLPEEEGDYAALTAQALQLPHDTFYYEDYDLELLPTDPSFVAPEPAPTINDNTSSIAHYHHATRHAPVMLSGIGGDLALAMEAIHWQRLPKGKKLAALYADMRNTWQLFGPSLPSGFYIKQRMRQWQQRKNDRLLPFPHWLQPDFVDRLQLQQRKAYFDEIDAIRNHRKGMVSYSYWTHHMRMQDPAYTGIPLKFYYPFFDVRLYRYLLSISPQPWFKHKALLRLAMRGILPEAIVTRPKTPLTRDTNIEHTKALTKNRAWQLALLDEPALSPYIVPSNIQAVIRAPEKTEHPHFRLANIVPYLAYWLRHHHQIIDTRSPKSAEDVNFIEHVV